MSGNGTQKQAVVYSHNPKAHKLFLKARDYFNKSDPRTGGTLADAREAITHYEQAVKVDPKFALAFVELSRAWMTLGYSEPDGISNKEFLPHAKAAVYLALGDKDQAIEWLKKDFEVKDNWMNQLKVDPVMDPLQSDPRFQVLLRKMKFKE